MKRKVTRRYTGHFSSHTGHFGRHTGCFGRHTGNTCLNNLDKEVKDDGLKIDFWGWTRDFSSLASTEAVYGAEYPFKHEPGLIEAFW